MDGVRGQRQVFRASALGMHACIHRNRNIYLQLENVLEKAVRTSVGTLGGTRYRIMRAETWYGWVWGRTTLSLTQPIDITSAWGRAFHGPVYTPEPDLGACDACRTMGRRV